MGARQMVSACWAGDDRASKKDSGLRNELKRLVEDETGGQPTGGKQFVRSSLRHLAERLGKASRTTIARLLRSLGFSPRVNV